MPSPVGPRVRPLPRLPFRWRDGHMFRANSKRYFSRLHRARVRQGTWMPLERTITLVSHLLQAAAFQEIHAGEPIKPATNRLAG